MKTDLSAAVSVAALVAISFSSACGGGDGGTPPVTVASVVITSPSAAISFQTLGRTRQFTAQPKDAAGGNLSTAVVWSSNNSNVASVNINTGVVTALANGTAGIIASAGGQSSAALQVTVFQVPASIAGIPATVSFGALGSTKQLNGAVADSAAGVVALGGNPTFSRAGSGASATVSASGLVMATGVGIGDTVLATAGSIVLRAPIVVTQVVNSITVTSTSGTPDTLFTSTRTRQFSATARDSNNNIIGAAVFAWTSSVPGVATVGAASGLVTAGNTDGSTNIQAAVGAAAGTRPLVLRRYAATLTIAPPGPISITTAGGNQVFTGVAQDSVAANITIAWVSRSTSVVSLSTGTGTTTTATAAGNGSTFVVLSAGTAPKVRSDSAGVTTSNQPTAPMAITVNVGDTFFKSVRNNTQNPAVDTVAVGGTVTWTWVGALQHGVTSNGPPSFTNSPGTPTTGSYPFIFTVAGTYQYDCTVHGAAMTGRIVVQ